MDYITDLETACTFLGTREGSTYVKNEDCLECAKDLTRLLRRDDASHVLRRTLGQIGVVKSDLIALLSHSPLEPKEGSEAEELFDILLRILCNLTVPEETLFNNELPEDKTTRNFYIQLQTFRQQYKEAFVDEKVWSILSRKLGLKLRKNFDERSEDDNVAIERILILVRNVLQVPRDFRGENRTEDDATVHDQILWVMRKSEFHDLLLYVASSDAEKQYCLHVLEIISLIFREQDPKSLASANFQRSKEERTEDQTALLKLREEEEFKKRIKFHQARSTRHSRFGGVFTVSNVKSISEKALIYHKAPSTVNSIDFSGSKRPLKVAKHRLTPSSVDTMTRRSTLAIRLFLKEFCLDFINGAYNELMRAVKDRLDRGRAEPGDETYYLWAIKFFMEFNRTHKFRIELVSETMSTTAYYFIQQKIESYKDIFEHEKKNRPMCLRYSRRMHLGIRAAQELLLNLVQMSNSEPLSQSASVLKANILYEPEYRELCLTMFNIYKSDRMSLGFLKDLVETTHVFLKLMESMVKNKHMIVRSNKVVRRRKVPKAERKRESQRECNEQKWDKMSNVLSSLLQGNGGEIPSDVCPFDATSDVSMDDQRATALFKIQDLLRGEKCAEAIGLMRAARQVWPDNDYFGAGGDDVEEEFIGLRQILFSDVPRPAHLDPAKEDVGDDEEELEEEVDVVEQLVSTEQEFDFKGYLGRFAVKSVCAAYATLFQNFRKNSALTNHCIVKMFHRIAWECGQPGMLFHISILRSIQSIHKDYQIHTSDPSLKEMNKFGAFVLNRFFDVCNTNRKVFMELCFWKNSRDAGQIVDGYNADSGATGRQKRAFWTEDQELTLHRVFGQLKESGERKDDEDGDLLDAITAHFVESGKSRRQVAKKLRDLNLIQNIREVTRKALKANVRWLDEEVETLQRLYAEFKDANDPVARIKERLGSKRSTRTIIDKIIDLDLCDDRKSLRKKSGGRQRTREEARHSSESDSALEDSSSGESGSEDECDVGEEDGGVSRKERVLDLLKCLRTEEMKPVFEWLKDAFLDEAEDRANDPTEVEDVPLVPVDQGAAVAISDSQDFQKFMKMLGLHPPSQQERYWRLPSSMTVEALKLKASILERAVGSSEDLPVDDLVLNLTVETEHDSQFVRRKKKKNEKRGPNKWMPVRRTINDQEAERIMSAIGGSTKLGKQKQDVDGEGKENRNGSPSEPTPGKKTKGKTSRKKQSFLDESSSQEESGDEDKVEANGSGLTCNESTKEQLKDMLCSTPKEKVNKGGILDASSSDHENDVGNDKELMQVTSKEYIETSTDTSDEEVAVKLTPAARKKSKGSKRFLDDSDSESDHSPVRGEQGVNRNSRSRSTSSSVSRSRSSSASMRHSSIHYVTATPSRLDLDSSMRSEEEINSRSRPTSRQGISSPAVKASPKQQPLAKKRRKRERVASSSD